MQETPEPSTIITPTNQAAPQPAIVSSPVAAPVVSSEVSAEAVQETEQSDETALISWTASEFIAHDKTAGWYIVVMGAAVLVAALLYLIFKDVVISGVVVAAAAVLAVYGSHQPRQLEYRLGSGGIQVDKKYYDYDTFKSFAIMADGAFSSIVFMPLKRLGVSLTIYYDPKDEAGIIDVLSDRLPFEQRHPDPVDRLMRRIRF